MLHISNTAQRESVLLFSNAVMLAQQHSRDREEARAMSFVMILWFTHGGARVFVWCATRASAIRYVCAYASVVESTRDEDDDHKILSKLIINSNRVWRRSNMGRDFHHSKLHAYRKGHNNSKNNIAFRDAFTMYEWWWCKVLGCTSVQRH